MAGLNHAAHLVHQALRTVDIEITDEITGSTTLRGYPYNSGDYEVPTYKMTVSGTDMWGDYDAADYDVVRFGIKDSGSGASVVGLAAGKYKVSAFYANKITSQGAFHIKGKYFIHVGSVNKQSNFDGNNGCIAILGRANYDRFKIQLFSLSGGSNIYQIARSGVVNINMLITLYVWYLWRRVF